MSFLSRWRWWRRLRGGWWYNPIGTGVWTRHASPEKWAEAMTKDYKQYPDLVKQAEARLRSGGMPRAMDCIIVGGGVFHYDDELASPVNEKPPDGITTRRKI